MRRRPSGGRNGRRDSRQAWSIVYYIIEVGEGKRVEASFATSLGEAG